LEPYVNYNGNLVLGSEPVFTASSRAVRYGDGLFETMRWHEGKILLPNQHCSRLFTGLELLQFELPASFTWDFLQDEITKLVNLNGKPNHARIRLSVSRGEGSILDEAQHSPCFLIECWSVEDFSFDTNGLTIGVYYGHRKTMNEYANIKSANYLPSVLAVLFAKQKGWNEALLLNSENRICDAALSNVFWIKNGNIYTPPLSEGGIAGVVRSYLLKSLSGFTIEERIAPFEELMQADEVFLSSVIKGVQFVRTFGGRSFKNDITSIIFTRVVAGLKESIAF
jgi:branched-chain amino acid aminotransferase